MELTEAEINKKICLKMWGWQSNYSTTILYDFTCI